MPDIAVDISAASQLLSTVVRQIPFTTSLAINDLAFQVQRLEAANLLAVLKHPRPFTAKSVQVNRATKGSLTARVFIRPEVSKYLQPFESGGLHVLPGKALLDPVDIRLDQYGQLPRTTMALLRARKDIYIGPITTKSGVITGVWQRVAVSRAGNERRKRLAGGRTYHPQLGALKLLIRFGSAVPVTEHLNFVKRGIALVVANAGAAMANAFAKALSSAR